MHHNKTFISWMMRCERLKRDLLNNGVVSTVTSESDISCDLDVPLVKEKSSHACIPITGSAHHFDWIDECEWMNAIEVKSIKQSF